MLLPNADKAQIDERKLSGYLLSPTHPVGRFKASFFFAMGFDQDDSESLLGEQLRNAGSHPAKISWETRHGSPICFVVPQKDQLGVGLSSTRSG